jgi:hypothetical protein
LPERIQLGHGRNAPPFVPCTKPYAAMITALNKSVFPGIATSSPW